MPTEPTKTSSAPPSVPSADEAARAVKKKPGRKSDAERKEAAENELEQQMQAQFLGRVASMMTGAVDGSMSLLDMMYEKELTFDAQHHKTDPATFNLTETEQENVAMGIAMGLQTVSPAWLEKFGFPLMVCAIAASIAVPRLIMCYSLNQIREGMAKVEEDKKSGLDPSQIQRVPDPKKPKPTIAQKLNGDVRTPTNRIARKLR